MSITTEIDKIEILGDFNILQIRTRKTVKSGSDSATNFERYILTPTDDMSDQPDQIKALADIMWTDQIRAEYQTYLDTQVTQEKAENV